jgi:hypothetical protein
MPHHLMPHQLSELKIFLKIQRAWYITLCHVTFVHWKIILKIQENYLISGHLSPLKNNSKNSNTMPHHLMSRHISLLKNNSKKSRNHLMPYHLSLLKNNSENTRSMSHHLMPCHISPLKNNSKNSWKSPHPTSHLSIEK